MTRVVPLLLAGALLSGCTQFHLTYDFGRAYIDTLRLQADLTRPSVATGQYWLYGREGVSIRINVQAETAEAAEGEFTLEGRY
jgi:hypothetical protein